MVTKNSLSTLSSVFIRSVGLGAHIGWDFFADLQKFANKFRSIDENHNVWGQRFVTTPTLMPVGAAIGVVAGVLNAVFNDDLKQQVADYLNTKKGPHPISKAYWEKMGEELDKKPAPTT